MDFYHANYPEGVREKSYELETIERNKEFILAASCHHKPVRYLLISSITKEWLVKNFDVRFAEGESVEAWLERHA